MNIKWFIKLPVIVIREICLIIGYLIIHYPTSSLGNLMRVTYYKRMLNISIGKNPTLNSGIIICKNAKILIGDNFISGDNIYIDPNDSLGIIIGDNVAISQGVYLRSGNHNYSSLDIPIVNQGHIAKKVISEKNEEASIMVDDDVWIAPHSIILSGAKIGKGSIISAGSVVSSEIPPYSIVAGNPARVIANREKLNFTKGLVKFP